MILISRKYKNVIILSFVFVVYSLIIIGIISSFFESRISTEILSNDREAYESFVFGNTVFLFLNLLMYLNLVFNSVFVYKNYRNFLFSDINIFRFLFLEGVNILKNKYYILHLLTYLSIVHLSISFLTFTEGIIFTISSLIFQIGSLMVLIATRILIGHNSKGMENFPTVLYFVLSLFFITIITQNNSFLYPLYLLVDLPFGFVFGFKSISLLSSSILVLVLVGAYFLKKKWGAGFV